MTRRFPHAPGRTQAGYTALAVVLIYACFAALWILLSDHVVELLFQTPAAVLLASTVKGWLFVTVTSVLLYGLLRRRSSPPAAGAPSGLRRRVLPIVGVMGLVLGAVVSLSIWHNLSEERDNAALQLQAVSESKAREVSSWLAERLRDAGWAHKSVGLREAWLRWRESGRRADELRMRQFLTTFFVSDQIYSRIDVVDTQGRRWLNTVVSAAEEGVVGLAPLAHLTLHQGVLEAITIDRPVRVGPWRDADGRLWLSFVAPLAPHSHVPAAVILHHELGPYLHATLRDWPVPQQTAEVLLFRTDGEALVMLSALRHEAGAVLHRRIALDDAHVLSARLVRGSARVGELIVGLDYRGMPSYGVGQRIEGTDWWLLAKQDRAELMHNALIRSMWMTLAAALALLALGTAMYLYDERRRLGDKQREIDELRRIEHSLSESEAQYRLLTENTSDVVWLYDVERDRYVYTSPSVQAQLGYTQEEMQGFSIEQLVVPEQISSLREGMARRLRGLAGGDDSRRTATDEVTVRHKNGHTVPLEIVSTLLSDPQGRVQRILGISRDVTQRKQAQAQLQQLSQAVAQSPASVIIAGLDGRIEYVNPAFERMSGYRAAEVQGQKPALLRSGRTPREVYANLWATLRDGRTWSGELVNRRKDGTEYVQSMNMAPLRDAQGRTTHYLAVQMDVTEQREAERKAHQLAWFSQLTGLPNRHRLLVELENAQHLHERTGDESMLLLLNLDRFQTVNDALGHAAGDQLLVQVGERLGALLHADDTLAHLSADEFAIVLHGRGSRETASAHALRFAQEVHAKLDAPFDLGGREVVNVSCCIGITPVFFSASDSPGEALRHADTALHRAKAAGTRQTALFDTSMEELISRRFAIEQDLRRGLQAGELRLYLQPQVNAQGHMVAAEALVRWQHPQHGLLAPGHFIPIAEESELITEIGRWVLKAVCQIMGQLQQEDRHLQIAVNISPRQFHQPGFVHVVQDILQGCHAAPADLVIEITEGIVMDRMDSVVQKMAHLNSLGVRFSLDDFGTGYSSLAYLKRLPIHEIKIDRSFVQDAPNDPNSAALVDAMLSVARHLRLKVVAEGVETREQAQFLSGRGELLQQGYLHGRPAPADEVLARWRASLPQA